MIFSIFIGLQKFFSFSRTAKVTTKKTAEPATLKPLCQSHITSSHYDFKIPVMIHFFDKISIPIFEKFVVSFSCYHFCEMTSATICTQTIRTSGPCTFRKSGLYAKTYCIGLKSNFINPNMLI